MTAGPPRPLGAGRGCRTYLVRPVSLFLISFLIACIAAPALWANEGGLTEGGLSSVVTVPEEPLQVGLGITVDQVTFVDQKSENFGAVVTIRMGWKDPLLAFEAGVDTRHAKVMTPADFVELARSLGTIVPAFVVQNQQGKRWIQHDLVVIFPDGRANYFEKSSVTLQAPYFNFTRYPFDTQKFFVEIVSVLPANIVQLVADNDRSGLGELLGEEEWILENARTLLFTTEGISGIESSMIALAFEGRRHILYYAIRIFLPMLVLVAVSWAVFFLDEYRKRIEIAGANLLVFVAFNWAISADLPKLGYLTFLDFILQWMFVVTGAIIVFSVILSRLKASGRGDLARKLDIYAVKWVYPLGYAAIVGFAVSKYLMV